MTARGAGREAGLHHRTLTAERTPSWEWCNTALILYILSTVTNLLPAQLMGLQDHVAEVTDTEMTPPAQKLEAMVGAGAG
jgi:hypothetical protein